MATWAERRGFTTTITERLFDGHTRRQPHEPSIALCGLDNAEGRRSLDRAGFDFVAEAGLGRGHADFRSILVHTLPGAAPAAKLWESTDVSEGPVDAAAYRKLVEEGSLDRCGVTLLAGKAVGAPFVGAAAATVVIAQVLRLLHGAPVNRLVDLNLIDVDHRRSAPQIKDVRAQSRLLSQESPHFFSRTHKSPILMEIARRDWKSAARVDHAETD
jgi:hypothetical protein